MNSRINDLQNCTVLYRCEECGNVYDEENGRLVLEEQFKGESKCGTCRDWVTQTG